MALTMPIYAVVDMRRPLPNFIIDRTSSIYSWTLLVFSTAKQASDFAMGMMASDKGLKLDFTIIHTSDEFRGILVALSELCPALKWVHLDPSTARRNPKRFAVKDMIDGIQKKKG